VEELTEIPDFRRWQIEQLGEDFVRALRKAPSSTQAGKRATPTSERAMDGTNGDDSPYKQ